MNRLITIILCLATLPILNAPPALADTAYHSAKVIHKMSFVVDRQQKLIFLELTNTNGMSRHEINQAMASGKKFSRYHYATLAEVKALALDAGVPEGKITTEAELNNALQLVEWLGVTSTSCQPDIARACHMTSSGSLNDMSKIFYITVDFNAAGKPTSATAGSEKSGFKESSSSKLFGHFLVKNFTKIQ